MFLELKPVNDILQKVFPRQLPYILKQFGKCWWLVDDFTDFPAPLADKMQELIACIQVHESLNALPLEDMRSLMNLIKEHRKALEAIILGTTKDTSEETIKVVAYYLLKMLRMRDAISYVMKQTRRYKQNSLFTTLVKPVEFVFFNCHPELAIVKTAKDYCISKT